MRLDKIDSYLNTPVNVPPLGVCPAIMTHGGRQSTFSEPQMALSG